MAKKNRIRHTRTTSYTNTDSTTKNSRDTLTRYRTAKSIGSDSSSKNTSFTSSTTDTFVEDLTDKPNYYGWVYQLLLIVVIVSLVIGTTTFFRQFTIGNLTFYEFNLIGYFRKVFNNSADISRIIEIYSNLSWDSENIWISLLTLLRIPFSLVGLISYGFETIFNVFNVGFLARFFNMIGNVLTIGLV